MYHVNANKGIILYLFALFYFGKTTAVLDLLQ